MKKTVFIAAILMTCFCCAFAADTSFRMSDGTKISGKVISVTDNTYTVETESGIVTINNNDVQRVKGQKTPDFRANYSLKDNMDYSAYKRNFKIGLGFFIPGTIFMATPILFCTGFAVNGFMNYASASNDVKASIASGLSCYFLSIGIGLIFELISIPFFITADKHYRRAVEQYKVSFDAGFSNESLKMAMNVSF